MNLKSQQPEPERMVRLHCEDWSPYRIEGKFVKYKPGSGKRTGQARFMSYDKKLDYWESNRNAWKDCETWEYIDNDQESKKEIT
jgi:hypothetical protein